MDYKCYSGYFVYEKIYFTTFNYLSYLFNPLNKILVHLTL
uniref:Uncharacterized protein n=1 Tax=Arundo donax TaxID=35708 RepID=A0A0A9ANA8_ARUDO